MRYLLALGQSLDSITFAAFFLLIPPYLITEAGKAERNPILAWILAIGGVVAVVAVKQGLAAFAVWRLRNTNAMRFTVLAGLAGASGFVGAAFNTFAILQIMR